MNTCHFYIFIILIQIIDVWLILLGTPNKFKTSSFYMKSFNVKQQKVFSNYLLKHFRNFDKIEALLETPYNSQTWLSSGPPQQLYPVLYQSYVFLCQTHFPSFSHEAWWSCIKCQIIVLICFSCVKFVIKLAVQTFSEVARFNKNKLLSC